MDWELRKGAMILADFSRKYRFDQSSISEAKPVYHGTPCRFLGLSNGTPRHILCTISFEFADVNSLCVRLACSKFVVDMMFSLSVSLDNFSASIPIGIEDIAGGASRSGAPPGTKIQANNPEEVKDSSIPSGSECAARVLFRWCRSAQPPATVFHPCQDEELRNPTSCRPLLRRRERPASCFLLLP